MTDFEYIVQLEDGDKVKILDALSKTTKGNLKWAESKRKQLKTEK